MASWRLVNWTMLWGSRVRAIDQIVVTDGTDTALNEDVNEVSEECIRPIAVPMVVGQEHFPSNRSRSVAGEKISEAGHGVSRPRAGPGGVFLNEPGLRSAVRSMVLRWMIRLRTTSTSTVECGRIMRLRSSGEGLA